MKFSKDFDNYAREVLHIENPFREFYRTQDSTFKAAWRNTEKQK